MDILLDFIAMLSHWCNKHMDQISLSIVAVLLVLFGSVLGSCLKHFISRINITVRVIMLAIVYMLIFGILINYLPSLVKQLLTQLNCYSLFPVLLLITIFIGMIADKR